MYQHRSILRVLNYTFRMDMQKMIYVAKKKDSTIE